MGRRIGQFRLTDRSARERRLTIDEAATYHRAQIETLADTDADLISPGIHRSIDDATGAYPAYYMINCAHPSHFDAVLDPDATWMTRIKGIRANASSLSHAELDNATELDAGDPVAFGREYADIRSRFPSLTVLGGCCGTDLRHIQEVASACL